jgi:hypothetical protein
MPTVTSENKDDFVQNALEKNKPDDYQEEPNNPGYNKYAAKAAEATANAEDWRDHREADKAHAVANGLAQTPENRAFHRAKSLEHESMADSLERKERRDIKRGVAREQVAKSRAMYEKATRMGG